MSRATSDRPFEPSEVQMMFEALGLGSEKDRAALQFERPDQEPECRLVSIRVGTTTSDVDEDETYAQLA